MKSINKKTLLTFIAIAVIVMLAAVRAIQKNNATYSDWPETGLGSMLPEPDKGKIEIVFDWDDLYEARVTKYGKNTYKKYLAACKELGFTVEARESSDSYWSTYEAYTPDGYLIYLDFYPSEKYFQITLKAPEELTALSWPSIGMAPLLPKPGSTLGKIITDRADRLSVLIGNTTIDDFNKYIDACIEKGFNQDYDRYDKSYSAKDAAGNKLIVRYEGANRMSIVLEQYEEPEPAPVDPPKEVTPPAETPEKPEVDLSGSLEDFKNLASEGEEALKEKLGDLYQMIVGLFGKSQSYEDIYNEYSQKIKDRTPGLIEEYTNEAANHAGDIAAQAEIVNDKVYILAEISNEGVEKMAALYYKNLDYETYESWATKLYDVYMEYAEQVYNVYLDTAG